MSFDWGPSMASMLRMYWHTLTQGDCPVRLNVVRSEVLTVSPNHGNIPHYGLRLWSITARTACCLWRGIVYLSAATRHACQCYTTVSCARENHSPWSGGASVWIIRWWRWRRHFRHELDAVAPLLASPLKVCALETNTPSQSRRQFHIAVTATRQRGNTVPPQTVKDPT